MISDATVILRGNLGDAHHIDQECHQFVTAVGQILRPCLHGWIVEQPWIVMAQHAAARARRGHYGVVALEGIDNLGGDGARRGAVTGVIGWLAAADLERRDLNRAAGLLEELYGG